MQVACNKVCEAWLLGKSGGMPLRKSLDFRLSEIVSCASCSELARVGQHLTAHAGEEWAGNETTPHLAPFWGLIY